MVAAVNGYKRGEKEIGTRDFSVLKAEESSEHPCYVELNILLLY